METNAKGCIIKIKIGDEIKEFKSDRELDGYLYDHRETLSQMLDGKLDKTFSIIEDPFNNAVATFDSAVEESRNIHNVTRNTASIEERDKIETMATTRFVHQYGLPDDWSRPIIDWDEEKRKTKEYLRRKGLSDKEADVQTAIENEVTNINQKQNINDFATNFGIAFQIKDDLLNITQNDNLKPSFSDIENGIYTAPIIYLQEIIPNLENINAEEIKKLIITNPQIIDKTKQLIETYKKKATDSISFIENNKYKQEILNLINSL